MVAPNQTSESALAVAIERIGRPNFSPALADWLNASVPCDNLSWLAYFQHRGPELLMAQNTRPEVHENIESVYLEGAYLLDPFHDLHLRKAERGVYRLSENSPDKFKSNQYFTEYYRHTTLIDELAFICYPNPGVSIHICLGRDKSSNRRFSPKTIAAARRIAPIVSSLVESHWSGLDTTGAYDEAEITARLIRSAQSQLAIQLSPRQSEVAMLILRGHSSISIGLKLGISAQTVKVFRKQLYKKCGISSQAELFNLLLPLLGQ